MAAQTPGLPRPEYPRPDLARTDWQSLNGPWEFEFDDRDRGLAEGWHRNAKPFSKKILVPYCFQSSLSGIGDTSFHDVVWYRRTVRIPQAWRSRRVMLNFGAVDYEAQVWVNGDQAGSHRGGNVGFALDITDYLKAGDNTVVVRAWDPSTDRSIPRGKQYWKPQSESIFYTSTSGIWQTVWLEPVAPIHISRLRITPDVDNSQVSVEAILSKYAAELTVRAVVRLGRDQVAQAETAATGARSVIALKLPDQQLWSPERPTLYDVIIELAGKDGGVIDRVESYFGQRKISAGEGRIYLNNSPYYLRLVLDQGYWPGGILTAPTDESVQYDIKITRHLGFNGARKHQKVEDPRWLYWCDKIGLLVWGEMANAFVFNDQYVARFTEEWQQVIARDYNHPSIIAWTPINESWGVPEIRTSAAQQAHAKALYFLTRSLDSTRLVSDNDGWEHTDATDIFGLHDYARTGDELAAKYKILETDRSNIPRNAREALAQGHRYNNTPILITEFGGIAYRVGLKKSDKEWGYSGIEQTKEAFLMRLDGLVKALRANKAIAGYCYTQLTDVEQEINGLLSYDRKPKADPAEFAKIFAQ